MFPVPFDDKLSQTHLPTFDENAALGFNKGIDSYYAEPTNQNTNSPLISPRRTPDTIWTTNTEKFSLDSIPRNKVIPSGEITLHGTIGSGFFGAVSKGMWRGRKVAVKKITRQTFRKLSSVDLFGKEIKIWSILDNQYIVAFLGICINAQDHYIVTEYMDGGNLQDFVLQQGGLLTVQRILSFAKSMAAGVAYLHGHTPSIIHRDLTPNNVLLDSNFINCKVADFGLSRFKNPQGLMSAAVGSLVYMAPEIYKGERYNEKADVYSFAIILWFLFSKTQPHVFHNVSSDLFASLAAMEQQRPSLKRVEMAQCWKNLIRASWNPDFNQRPSFVEILNLINR